MFLRTSYRFQFFAILARFLILEARSTGGGTAKPNDGGAVNDPEIRNFLKRVLDKAGWPLAAGVIRKVQNPTNRNWLVVWNMISIFPYIGKNHPN
jgi:hypothetical protein